MSKKSKFPLYKHRNGQWAKRVKGKLLYFGTDKDEALAKWLADKEYLAAGYEPPKEDDWTVKEMCNIVYHEKSQANLDSRTLLDYKKACERILSFFDPERPLSTLRPKDFFLFRQEIEKPERVDALSPETLRRRITEIRVIFNHFVDSGRTTYPVTTLWGKSFQKPSESEVQRHRGEADKWIEPEQFRKLLRNANPMLHAAMMLSVNAGFGNKDCATLPVSSIDLEGKWISWPRPKTGVRRKVFLWDETVESIENYLTSRPEPKKENRDLLFVTPKGDSYAGHRNNHPIARAFYRLKKKCNLNFNEISFYAGRHVFLTIAEHVCEKTTKVIMGHMDKAIAAKYRNLRMYPEEKIINVVEEVRNQWFLK